MKANRFRNSLRWFRRSSTPRTMLLAGVVGTGSGLGAVALIKAVEWVGDAFGELARIPIGRAWVFISVPIGLYLALRLTQWLGPEAKGHGVPQVIAALVARAGRIKFRIAPLKVVVTALTLGAGGSAGREGPIAQIGGSLGSSMGRRLNLGEAEVRGLIAGGVAAGISATFNAPIAGMLFALEVVLGSFSVTHLSTVVVASVGGAVVSHGLLGEALIFEVPTYPLNTPEELILYGVLGLAVAVAGYVFLHQLDWWEDTGARLPQWLRVLTLGAVVAGLGVWRPEVLGTGQAFVGDLLRNDTSLAWAMLLALAAIKAVATSATFAAGGSGGIFMPSLFMGAAVGSGFATLIGPYWSVSTIQPGAFAVVGMAAAFAAVARAPLTSMLIVFETTGDYGLVLPLMFATLVAATLAHRLHPLSAYEMVLTRLGVSTRRVDETDLLDGVTVGQVVPPDMITVSPAATLAETQGLLDRNRLHGVPVAENGILLGILTVSDIARAGGPSDSVTARDAMVRNPVTVTLDTSVSQAMQRMASLGVGRLPVVDPADGRRLCGVFRREDAVVAYHRAVGSVTHRTQAMRRSRVRTTEQADFFEVEIPPHSRAAGKTVREVPWPEGCLIVSVRRGADVLVAKGNVVIEQGDVVTGFGSHEARRRLAERVSPPAETNEAPAS